jgi:hypothetical protein
MSPAHSSVTGRIRFVLATGDVAANDKNEAASVPN